MELQKISFVMKERERTDSMRLGDLDEMAVIESESYISAQTKIDNPITQGVNSVVHRKIQQLIADTPTIDAVPVVRCLECRYHVPKGTICMLSGMEITEDDFCSRGQRKIEIVLPINDGENESLEVKP